MRKIVSFLLLICFSTESFGWSEGGHHLIAVMAWDRLTADQQAGLIEILKQHPRFAEDFKLPESVKDDDEEASRWLIGRAGYWPDIARRGPYDRPNWHWQLGSTLTIGNPPNVPANPGPCPDDATADTADLHIAQAIELNRRILRDKNKPAAERAVAICWLAHLVADSHQPCHAGSLYTEKLFPDGDRGANSIKTGQRGNLHSVWDGLLGPRWEAGDIKRRQREIEQSEQFHALEVSLRLGYVDTATSTNPRDWLAESNEYGRRHVYSAPVLDPIKAAEQAAGNSRKSTYRNCTCRTLVTSRDNGPQVQRSGSPKFWLKTWDRDANHPRDRTSLERVPVSVGHTLAGKGTRQAVLQAVESKAIMANAEGRGPGLTR